MEELDTEIKVGEWIDTIEIVYRPFIFQWIVFGRRLQRAILELKGGRGGKMAHKGSVRQCCLVTGRYYIDR